MQLIVITNCSSRKTAVPSPALHARRLQRGDVYSLAENWSDRCRAGLPRIPAGHLYSGRAFKIAERTALNAGADLLIVSAGFGLLRWETPIPAYELTISPHADCILSRSGDGLSFSAEQWWRCPRSHQRPGNTFKHILQQSPSAYLILAVTNPYLQMISGELTDLRASLLERVRIVGPKSPQIVSEPLSSLVVPYDDRLNDARLRLGGTEFDFAARAASHFVSLVAQDKCPSPLEGHKRRVEFALDGLSPPNSPVRSRITDKTLLTLIAHFKEKAYSKSHALRQLRDGIGCACSQERFTGLWEIAQNE